MFFVAHYDQLLRHTIAHHLKQSLERSLDGHVSFELNSFNMLQPTLELKNLVIHPRAEDPHHGWMWQCQRLKIHLSWLRFIRNGAIDMAIEFDNLDMQSVLQDKVPAISHHLRKLIENQRLPFCCFIKSFSLQKATCTIYDRERNAELKVSIHSSSSKINELFKSKINIIDGYLKINNDPMITDLFGTCVLDLNNTVKGAQCITRIDSRFCMPKSEPNNFYLSGQWNGDHGRFALRNADDSCTIDPIIITQRQQKSWLQLNARVPIAQARACLPHKEQQDYFSTVDGLCIVRLLTTLDQSLSHIDAHILFENMQLKEYPWHVTSALFLNKRLSQWSGNTSLRVPTICEIKSNLSFNQATQEFSCSFANDFPLCLPGTPYWKIEKICGDLKTAANGVIEGPLTCTVNNKLINSLISTDATARIKENKCCITGALENDTYQIDLNFSAFPFFEKALYQNNKNMPLLELSCPPLTFQEGAAKTVDLQGRVNMTLVRLFLQKFMDQQLQAEGTFVFNGTLNKKEFNAAIELENGTIRLPHTFNFANKFSAQLRYELASKKLVLSDAWCQLHTGKMNIPHASAQFDDKYNLIFTCVPLLIDHCLFNIKHDLFAMISGSLMIRTAAKDETSITGNIIIDKSQMTENIFANTFQKQLFQHANSMLNTNHPKATCHITLETKDLIHIDTTFLQAQARAHLIINHNLSDPDISGRIELSSGSLLFPYKPLYITKGSLIFLPEQRHNPVIELTAKNTIKKHKVALQVSGSLTDHHVLFESTPPLSEEQIISLLFVGSAQESLNVMAPALIVQNVKKLLFGIKQSSILDHYFKQFVKPFSVNLVPSFTDQSGRGGLRGAIEIDVNDQLRATIQKNFSLSEDTRVEVEYAASEDVTVRGTRSERRDLGGEIEMRWKF